MKNERIDFQDFYESVQRLAFKHKLGEVTYYSTFGRKTIHIGKPCVAFFDEGKVYLRPTNDQQREQWLKDGSTVLISPMRYKNGIDMNKSCGDLEVLTKKTKANLKSAPCPNWLLAPSDVINDDEQLAKNLVPKRYSRNHIKIEVTKENAGIADNPSVNSPLLRLLEQANLLNTEAFEKFSAAEIYLKITEFRQKKHIDQGLIKRIIAVKTSNIYTWVDKESVSKVLNEIKQLEQGTLCAATG